MGHHHTSVMGHYPMTSAESSQLIQLATHVTRGYEGGG